MNIMDDNEESMMMMAIMMVSMTISSTKRLSWERITAHERLPFMVANHVCNHYPGSHHSLKNKKMIMEMVATKMQEDRVDNENPD